MEASTWTVGMVTTVILLIGFLFFFIEAMRQRIRAAKYKAELNVVKIERRKILGSTSSFLWALGNQREKVDSKLELLLLKVYALESLRNIEIIHKRIMDNIK